MTKVFVEYCSSCGTFDKFKKIQRALEAILPDLTVEGAPSTKLANLEVRVEKEGIETIVWNRRRDGNKKSAEIAELVKKTIEA